jgi:hypothetical protein
MELGGLQVPEYLKSRTTRGVEIVCGSQQQVIFAV